MTRGDFGGKGHVLTMEDRVKGGKAQTGLQKLQTAVAKRRRCGEDCPLWPCSVAQYAAIPGPTQGMCALKAQPKKVQRQIMSIAYGGRAGFIEVLSSVIGNIILLSEKKHTSLSEQRRLLQDLERFHRVAYGERQNLSAEEPVRIIVNWKKGSQNEAKGEAIDNGQQEGLRTP